MKTPFLFAVSGVKNSGKTTFCEKLIPALAAEGLRVAVIKHDGHEFEADVPGTDSSRCFAAGAVGTAVFSATKFCAVRRWSAPDLAALTALFPEADVILLEGFKHWPGPKIELVRRGNSTAPVCTGQVLAIATDLPALDTGGLPCIGLEDAAAAARIIRDCREGCGCRT